MILAFNATTVECADALDGEILQVCFDTIGADCDEDHRDSPYILIGRSFELPVPPSIEWHDGNDYDASDTIRAIALRRHSVFIKCDRNRAIKVTFDITDDAYADLASFMKRIVVRSRILFSAERAAPPKRI